MKDMKNRTFWLTVAIIALLGVSVIVQGIAIYGLHSKVDAISPAEALEPVARTTQPAKPSVTQPSNRMPNRRLFDYYDNWDPFQEMQAMHDQINQMFGNAYNRFGSSDDFSALLKDYRFSPDIDIEDKGKELLITVDLPGIDDSHLKINVENRTLTISGSSHSETKEEDKGGKILRQERQSGNFYRMVTLPVAVNPDDIKTENKDGILYITLQKTEH